MGTGSSTASSNNVSSIKLKKGERYSALPSSSNVTASSNALVSDLVQTPENSFKKSFRSLLRASNFESPIQTQMLVLGMPRPSDIAPSVQHMSHTSKKHNRNASTGKPFRVPNSDIISSSRSQKQSNSMQNVENNDCFPIAEDRYYNAVPVGNFLQNGRRHSIGAYFSRKPSANISRNEPQIQEETSFSNETSKVNFRFPENLPPVANKSEALNDRKKCCSCQTSKGKKIIYFKCSVKPCIINSRY